MIPIGFMFIECVEGSQNDLLQRIKEIPGVSYAYKLDKTYNLVVKVESDSVDKFALAIAQIRKLGNLLNTDTMVGFKG
ncbi:AsnC family protein [Candidatus Nitrososphaera evergladensis SR1]|uniref:AsnC family protein n=2 Tax=Nitrososphaera TaxID=497726 RepID=A0A075MMT1_9ARCH|nr:AsnC family protein [Candidatus Nitrososphaera evergladensis SR1]